MDSVWIECKTHFRIKYQKTENNSKNLNLVQKYRKFKKEKNHCFQR